MEKTRYAELRRDVNRFPFNYYLEEQGKVKDEHLFKQYLGIWFKRMGLEWRSGITMVVKYLDSKYQYSR